jgi:hypothetical protein
MTEPKHAAVPSDESAETQHTAGPVQDPAEEYKAEVPENPHHDDTDVDEALNRETEDGKGGAVVPKEDFESYTDPSADQPTEQEGDAPKEDNS